jgi:hypothetical protein
LEGLHVGIHLEAPRNCHASGDPLVQQSDALVPAIALRSRSDVESEPTIPAVHVQRAAVQPVKWRLWFINEAEVRLTVRVQADPLPFRSIETVSA